MEPLQLVPGRYIGEGHSCFIIAEIGQNHQGDIDIAKSLINAAKDSGADCVKLQKSCLTSKFTESALSRTYDSENSFGPTYGDHKRHLEFTEDNFRELQEYAKEVGIPLTASAMDLPSIDVLAALEVPFLKIGSGDAHNLQLIRKAADVGCPLVMSTGMCDIAWVSEMYRDLCCYAPQTPIVLLQCTSSYPVPSTHVHLRVMDTYAQMFPKAHIGYSGHEIGIHISVAAVARGARVLERHLTLNKNWKGSDHVCSLEPDEFKQLVQAVRNVESALGSPLKAMQPSEDTCYRKLGKSVVATRDMLAGEEITENDIVAKVSEPPGLSAQHLLPLIGRKLSKNVTIDQPITEHHLVR